MSHTNLKIGCAGAGVLGGAIMQRLLESRCDVMVWNRTPERLQALTAFGAKMAAEPVELSHHADFILTCLTDGAAVEAVVFGSKGVAVAGSDDKILIDMSTADPVHTTSMAARLLNQCGMRWIDAPISGGAPAARNGHLIAGGVLVLAGIFQFTPWKHACLEHCRTPLQFLTERRRSGPSGALLMGLEHGTFCLGCCWILMALLLVGGIMNLYWIAGLTFFVVVEKLVKYGDKIAYVAGVLMAGTGTYLLVSAG